MRSANPVSAARPDDGGLLVGPSSLFQLATPLLDLADQMPGCAEGLVIAKPLEVSDRGTGQVELGLACQKHVKPNPVQQPAPSQDIESEARRDART